VYNIGWTKPVVEKRGLEKIFTIGAVKKGVDGGMGQGNGLTQTLLSDGEGANE